MSFSYYFWCILFFLHHHSQFFFFNWFSYHSVNKNEYFGLFLYSIPPFFILLQLFGTNLPVQSSSPTIQNSYIDSSSRLPSLTCSNQPFLHSPLYFFAPIFDVSWISASFTYHTKKMQSLHTHTHIPQN